MAGRGVRVEPPHPTNGIFTARDRRPILAVFERAQTVSAQSRVERNRRWRLFNAFSEFVDFAGPTGGARRC